MALVNCAGVTRRLPIELEEIEEPLGRGGGDFDLGSSVGFVV